MTSVDDALARAEELLGQLNERREELERLAAADDVDGEAAVDSSPSSPSSHGRSRPS